MPRNKGNNRKGIEIPHIERYKVNGKTRNDTFSQPPVSLMLSEAFRSLTHRQKCLVQIAAQQLYGQAKPKEVYRDCGYTDECFFLTLCEVHKYGEYLKDPKAFSKDKKILVERGILDLVTQGKYGKMSVYKFSSKWIAQEGTFCINYNEETSVWTYHNTP